MTDGTVPGDPWWYEELGILPGTDNLPYGLKVGHTWFEVGTILRLIQIYNIKTFIEIGVHEGGLASILMPRGLVDPEWRYLGIEIQPHHVQPATHRMFAALAGLPKPPTLLIADCLTENTRILVSRLVTQSVGPSLIYCDNGDKPREVAYYRDVPKVGDILATHDYQGSGGIIEGLRSVRDLPDYGLRAWPAREVSPLDLDCLAPDYEALPEHYLEETRIAAYKRTAKNA